MVFVNRSLERARLDILCAELARGTVERHLALIGPRRIGKSKIIEDVLDRRGIAGAPLAVALVQMDSATATPHVYLTAMIRAVVEAFDRRAGRVALDATATTAELATEAALLDPELGRVVGAAIRLLSDRTADGHRVFAVASGLPAAAGRASGIPVLVLADEFQHIVDLAGYAPFRARGGTPGEKARQKLLEVFRAATERQAGAGWVVTGSAVRLMLDILEAGPLMGRLDILSVTRFEPEDTRRLARSLWDGLGIAHTERAADRVDALTLGHPFYADVVCRQAAADAHALAVERIEPYLVDRALLWSLHTPTGGIWIACKEMWDSLVAHTVPALRGMVSELARLGEASVHELAGRIGLPSETSAWPHARQLESLGVVEREGGKIRLADPIFRYWLVKAYDPEAVMPDIANLEASARVIGDYRQAYLGLKEDRGRMVEAYTRDLVRNFDGQLIEGSRFGRPDSHVRLPVVDDVRRIAALDDAGDIFGHPSEVELDLCFGTEATWLAEVRDRGRRPTSGDIDTLVRKASFLRRTLGLGEGETWFISFTGFSQEARERAREVGVLVSGERDLEAIGAATGIRLPTATGLRARRPTHRLAVGTSGPIR